eukprot:scaffold12474_cov55-Attheya_sp.AAC.1
MQILLVQTFIGVGVELLRIGPVVVAFIRGKVGPSLTEEERNATWLGLRPFSDPAPFLHAIKLYGFVLYFMLPFQGNWRKVVGRVYQHYGGGHVDI